MSSLDDQSQRDLFTQEISKNFSIIAPAGVGKTTVITQRITNIILHDAQRTGVFPMSRSLVAVTYTDKAAREIKDRVFNNILQRTERDFSLRKRCMSIAQNIFFGTIHAFAAKLLRDYAAAIDLRNDFEILSHDVDIWQRFLREFGDALKIVPEPLRNAFLSAHDVDQLVNKARAHKDLSRCSDLKLPPPLNINTVLSYEPKAGETKVKHFLKLLKEWDIFRCRGEYFSIPDCEEYCKGAGFLNFYKRELEEFLRWQASAEKFFLYRLAKAYREFRIKIGQLTYDDLITLSVSLLENSDIAQKIAKFSFSVILDEAQDTDEQQFNLLIGVCHKDKPLDKFPAAGYFSMVGDPQQSIYCGRADIKFYVNLHDALIKNLSASELKFSVTMRCPPAITSFVNERFSKIFSDISFVTLVPRQEKILGKLEIQKVVNKSEYADDRCFAKYISDFFRNKSPADFGIEHWSEVAILAPRKEWLAEISECFKKDISCPRVQLCFEKFDGNLASPLRWLTSCFRYVNNPADKREFAGILREIFGFQSQEIINHFKYNDSRACADVERRFDKLRSKRYELRLSVFLQELLAEMKIEQKIRAFQIYSERDLSFLKKQLFELIYFAEANEMNALDAEDYFISKIGTPIEDENIIANAVQLLTFHKSKGLEWPVVVLPFMFRGRKLKEDVSRNFCSKEEQFQSLYNNECRLLYVACTRAKRELILFDDSSLFSRSPRANMVSSGNILLI